MCSTDNETDCVYSDDEGEYDMHIDDDGDCLQYSRDDGSRGCGGVTAIYTRSEQSLVLKYWSLGDRAVEIRVALEDVDDESKTIRLATMSYHFEEYDEWARGSFETYELYKTRCCITARIVEDFISDVFGPDWTFSRS